LCWFCSWSQAEGLHSEGADCFAHIQRKSTFPCCKINQPKISKGGAMNKDTVTGTVDDVAGRTKRQIGEWTGDTNAQLEGASQQLKGKTEKVVGNVKDAAHDLKKDVERDHERAKAEREAESKHAVAGRG
jgi:uncharacterized protein YjbJ (UPF0337 family)